MESCLNQANINLGIQMQQKSAELSLDFLSDSEQAEKQNESPEANTAVFNPNIKEYVFPKN